MEIKYEVCGKLPDNTITIAIYKLVNETIIKDYTFYQVEKSDEHHVDFEVKTISTEYFNKLKENYQ